MLCLMSKTTVANVGYLLIDATLNLWTYNNKQTKNEMTAKYMLNCTKYVINN